MDSRCLRLCQRLPTILRSWRGALLIRRGFCVKHGMQMEKRDEEGSRGEGWEQKRVEKRRFQVGGLWRILSGKRRDEAVVPILNDWVAQGLPLHKNAVIVAISGLKREKRFKQALEVTEWVWKEQPFEMNDFDHLYRLYFMGEVGSIHDVEKCFAEIPCQWKTEIVCNQLISCYIARHMINEAKAIFTKARVSGHLISASSYNQFMAYFKGQYQDAETFAMFEEMKTAGVVPNTTTFNILLSIKARNGNLNAMKSLFKEMVASGIACDALSYTLMGKAYLDAGLLQKAQGFIRKLESQDTPLTRETRERLLSLYAEHGKLDEVELHWQYINSFNHVSYHSYGLMIESLGKLGQVQRAEDIVNEVKRKKGRLTMRIYNALLSVYCTNGMMEAAEDLVLYILQSHFTLNDVSYHHLAVGYLNIGSICKAVDMLKASQENVKYYHSKPWIQTLFLILETLAEKGDPDEAERIFCTFTGTGYCRTTRLYNALLKVYLKSRKPAHGFLDRMSADGIKPDDETLILLEENLHMKS